MRHFLAKYRRTIIYAAALAALGAGVILALSGATAWWALAVNAIMWGVVGVAIMPYQPTQFPSTEQNYIEDNDDSVPAPVAQKQIASIERISVRTGDKIRVLAVSEIKFIRSDGDYVEIFADDGHWLKEQTMKWFEQQLPESLFLRIHRSTIVNLERIARIERYGTAHQVQLHSGETLSVSNGGYKLLRERLGL